jgi:phosphoglycolate phosphatase
VPVAQVRAVLFDLDGTLVDSARDLHGAINVVLTRHGLAELTLAQVIGMVGDGVGKLTERAFEAQGAPLDADTLDQLTGEMVAVYSARLTKLTTLLPGAGDAVAALAANGLRLAVVTNKPRDAAVAILAHFGLAEPMGVIVGGDSGLPRKPHPDMLRFAIDALGVAASDAVMVGDGAADINAAKAAGIRAIAVRGGYAHSPVDALGADLVIGSLAGLPAALGFAG